MSSTLPKDYQTMSTSDLHDLLDELENDVQAGSTDANVESDIERIKDVLYTR